MGRYFTKSLHKKALECPTKLYYQSLPKDYDNNNLDNAFLQALATGGFQVGELAKIYFPGGVEVRALRSEEALAETQKLMENEKVTIYEPAIAFGEFLVRVDVLVKDGDSIKIYEVKAKSFDPDSDEFYNKTLAKKNIFKLNSDWKPYLYDIAFQTMVCRGAYPKHTVKPFLVLADKSKISSVEGLNQKFVIGQVAGRTKVSVAEGTDLKNVGTKILITVEMFEHVDRILKGEDLGEKSRSQLMMPSFENEAKAWAKAFLSGVKLAPSLSKDCRNCEFRTHGEHKSGFDECWTPALKKVAEKGELIIDLWNYRKTDDLIKEGRLFIKDLTQDDLKIEDPSDEGMGIGQRQWLQAEKVSMKDLKPEVDYGYLKRSIDRWKYPLHCIDFETTMAAIPFNAGRRPYEQIAFQFSHHAISEDGQVTHVGEYLHNKKGGFPNFDFLRALKKDLEKDEGTIFRYSNHENTVLCQIYGQLKESDESDKVELMDFIRTITKYSKEETWEGERNMVDLWDIVKKSYYHPLTYGSNSIKKVLPAILHQSEFLQKKYSKAIYGLQSGIKSLNFSEHVWLKRDDHGKVVDPYKQLPRIFEGIDNEVIETFMSKGDELAEGGAAMMAFGRMQFTQMSELETKALSKALLKYCELDTLAMVMIIEHFFELTDNSKHIKLVG